MTSRRDFTKALASLAVVSPLGRSVAGLVPSLDARHLTRLGVQLYTVRESMKDDVARTLARVRGIGYREVEFAGYFGKAPRTLRAALDANGLTAPSCHVPLEAITTGLSATLEAAHAIGHKWIIVPSIDDQSPAGYDRFADQLNAAGQRGRRLGIRMGYHNHDNDLHPWSNGEVPLERLARRLDPSVSDLEVDLYWVTKGGGNAKAWLHDHPGRIPLVHVKDAGPAPDFKMADVGAGAMDWRAILAERKRAGIRHYFIEHDEPADPWASITASYRYLSNLDL